MFNFRGNLTIFELLLLLTLVSPFFGPSQSQTETFQKGVASVKKNFGVLEHNNCADALQVIKRFRLNTSIWNL